MKRFFSLVAALVLLGAAHARAQLTFSGVAVYGGATTMTSFNSLPAPVISSPSTGISLTGHYYIDATAPSYGGNLLTWYVDRPISGGTSSFNITTTNIGYIDNTSGVWNGGCVLRTQILRSGAVIEESNVSDSFINNFTPISSTNTITVTGYTYVPGDFLRLIYQSQVGYTGPNSVFDVDFPAEAIITAIPEPTSAVLAVAGLGALALRRRGKVAAK